MKSFFKKIFPKSRFERKDGIFFDKLKKLLGFAPGNLKLYSEAFTHPSYQHKSNKKVSYERLEFLGDAILGSVIAHYLFVNAPEKNEGYLTKMRSKVVQRHYLNQLGKDLELYTLLRIEVPISNLGNNLNGNLFEALVGAVFLDKGYDVCSNFIHERLIKPFVDIKKLEGKVISYKSLLLEQTQKDHKSLHFEVTEDLEDSTNVKFFVAKLFVNDKILAKARDTSKKKAEEKASKRAFYKLQGKKP